MEYLFENPVPLVMVGLVLMTFTGVMFYTTRNTPALVALAIIAALTVSLLVMEQLIQTPREGVVTTLRAAAAASESNDVDRALDTLIPNSPNHSGRSPIADPCIEHLARADRFVAQEIDGAGVRTDQRT